MPTNRAFMHLNTSRMRSRPVRWWYLCRMPARMLAGGLLAVALLGCQPPEPLEEPTQTPRPTTAPTQVNAAFSFTWHDAGSGWYRSQLYQQEGSVAVSFSTYLEEFSPKAALTDDEYAHLWQLVEKAGILTLAEGNTEVGMLQCCSSLGYSAKIVRSGTGVHEVGSAYWIAETETDSQAALRTYVQGLREKYSSDPPPGEYVFHMSFHGGGFGGNYDLDLNSSTGKVVYGSDSSPRYCQATPVEILLAQSLLMAPGFWYMDNLSFGGYATDVPQFDLHIDTDGKQNFDVGYNGGSEPIPPSLAMSMELCRMLQDTCFEQPATP